RPHSSMEAHLRAADFLVQASHAEGSGVALIEALACGTTPLVTDIPSFRRITGAGAAGSLTPVGDAAGLANALHPSRPEERDRLLEPEGSRRPATARAHALRPGSLLRRDRTAIGSGVSSARAPHMNAPAWRIRPYRPGDERALVALWTEAFGRAMTQDQWR